MMTIRTTDKSPETDEGIVVEAPLELLRNGAERVLFEMTETLETKIGERRKIFSAEDIESGDSVIFKEEMDICPAEIVAIKIWGDQWYVISTAECPPSECPTTREAMRCAQAEAKRLRMLKKFLAAEAGEEHVFDLRSWNPERLTAVTDAQKIIDNATRRWTH
jgi:hypothetical protein